MTHGKLKGSDPMLQKLSIPLIPNAVETPLNNPKKTWQNAFSGMLSMRETVKK